MPYSLLGDLLGEATLRTLCHFPAKALRGVKAAKMSPVCHSMVKRITLCLPCAAMSGNPNWIMT